MRFQFILILLVVVSSSAYAQGVNTGDYSALVASKNFTNSKFTQKRVVKFLQPKSKNVFLRYNPVTLTFGGLLYFYQSTISQQIASECPYEISCSNFSKQCLQNYGLFKGVALSADRLSRCNEFLRFDLTPFNLDADFRIIDPINFYSVKNFPKP